MERLNEETFRYIVARLIDYANEAIGEARADRKDAFKSGRSLAYYEMLDVIQAELDIHEADLTAYGLNINLEKNFL